MDQRLNVSLVALAVVWFAGVACGEGPAEGWRVDFDDGTLGGAGEPRFVNRSEGPTRTDPDRASWKIADGVATIGGEFGPNSTRGDGDFVPLEWDGLNVSLVDYPVLEMRLRVSDEGGRILVQCTYAYADGSTRMPCFVSPEFEKLGFVGESGHQVVARYPGSEQPGEWVTLTRPIAVDISAPKQWTPRRLVKLEVWLMGDCPLTADIDWVRLRALNEEEQKKEDDWTAVMAGYAPTEPPIFKEFFPFGVYGSPPDSSGTHQMSSRMAFRMLAKHHLNYVQASQNRVVEGEEMGICLARRMRPCSQRFESGGASAVKEWAAPMVERVKNSPALICYDVGDEREIGELWDTVGGMGVLNQLDPAHPSLLCLHKVATLRRYDPYVAVNVSDIYPLSEGLDTTATYLYDYCREIARATNNKRHWMILQSFGAAPWRPRIRWRVPTIEQLRLQVWSALAGGARGIIMYTTSYEGYLGLADQWGNPLALMKEAARLGEVLIPLGRRLLDCVVDFDATVACDNENILVGVVHAPERGARYVILANKDEATPQGGRLSGVAGTLLDLEALEQVADGLVAPLLPGGGRIYMMGSADGFEREAEIILRNRAEEAARAATPDRLFETRGCNPKHRDQLDETARIMGAIEPAMFVDNPDAKVVEMMNAHRDRYWGIQERWILAYDALLKGEVVPDKDVHDILRDANGVVKAVRDRLGDYPMYPGEKPDTTRDLLDTPELWWFRKDPQEAGNAQKWFLPAEKKDAPQWSKISTHKFWEKGYLGNGWYALDTVIPQAVGKRVWLRFGSVDENYTLWINGQYIDDNMAAGTALWNVAVEVEITGKFKPGESNHIVVRVTNQAGGGGIWKPVTLLVEK